MRVVYNPITYQSKNPDIADCGRYDVFRIYTILKYNMDLDRFYIMMENLRRKTGDTYDEIVSKYIPKT